MSFVKSFSAFLEVPVAGVLNTSFTTDPGTNRLIVIIAIGERDSPLRGLPTVTLGGQAFTQILNHPEGTDGSQFREDHWVGIIKEADIPAGSAIIADWGSGNNDIGVAVFQFDDVPQANPTGNTGTRSSTNGFDGASITTAHVDSLILAANTSVRSSSLFALTTGWTLAEDIKTAAASNSGFRSYFGYRGSDPVGTYADCPGTLTSNLSALNSVAIEIRQGADGGPASVTGNDANHANGTDGILFSQNHLIVVGPAAHSLSDDAVSLAQIHLFQAGESGHGHGADAAVLSGIVSLVAANTGHGLLSAAAEFLLAGVLGPQNGLLVQSSAAAAFAQNHSYAADGGILLHTAEAVFLALEGMFPQSVRTVRISAPRHALTIPKPYPTHRIKGD